MKKKQYEYCAKVSNQHFLHLPIILPNTVFLHEHRRVILHLHRSCVVGHLCRSVGPANIIFSGSSSDRNRVAPCRAFSFTHICSLRFRFKPFPFRNQRRSKRDKQRKCKSNNVILVHVIASYIMVQPFFSSYQPQLTITLHLHAIICCFSLTLIWSGLWLRSAVGYMRTAPSRTISRSQSIFIQ